MPHLVMARLTKRVTDDGFCEMEDSVPLGTEYIVDLDRVEELSLLHVKTNTPHTKRVVWVVEGGFLPLDLLTIEKSDVN